MAFAKLAFSPPFCINQSISLCIDEDLTITTTATTTTTTTTATTTTTTAAASTRTILYLNKIWF